MEGILPFLVIICCPFRACKIEQRGRDNQVPRATPEDQFRGTEDRARIKDQSPGKSHLMKDDISSQKQRRSTNMK